MLREIQIGDIYKLRADGLDEGWETVKVVAAVPQMEIEGPVKVWAVHRGDGVFSETREITADYLLREADLL